MRRRGGPAGAGFSLVELVVALAVASVGLAAMAMLTAGVLGTFAAEPSAAEQQQRARAVAAVLADEMGRAGSGFLHATDRAPGSGTPAIVPDRLRTGAWSVAALPATVTILGGARSAAHARLAAPAAAGESRLVLERPPYCAPASPTCRFAAGDDIVLVAAQGAFAVATVRAVAPPLVVDLTAPLVQAWPAGATAAAVEASGFVVRPDPDTGLQQVAEARGAGPAMTLVDYVERFEVEWLVAGQPPLVRDAPDGTADHTTFGPLPPPAGEVGDPAWPPGENCLFARDGAGRPVSRLDALGVGPVLVPLSRLADGPWCPSPAAPLRWDADLARVVAVRVRLDLAVASASLRAFGGTLVDPARPGQRPVPRLTVALQVAPGRQAVQP